MLRSEYVINDKFSRYFFIKILYPDLSEEFVPPPPFLLITFRTEVVRIIFLYLKL